MALRPTALLDAASYGFEWLRLLPELALQEGVKDAGDFKVTAAAAGGLRVDVAAGTALVKGDSGTPGTGLTHGLYPQINDASIPSAVTLPAAHGTLPRVDQIILQINDSSDLGSAGNVPALTYVAGAATSGATLDNRSGAGGLPPNAMRLADVLVPAAATAVTAGDIRDRRRWVRGARYFNIGTGADYSVATTETTLFTAVRIEATGAPLRITARTFHFMGNVDDAAYAEAHPWISDSGGASARTGMAALQNFGTNTTGSNYRTLNSGGIITPPAGSILVGITGFHRPNGGASTSHMFRRASSHFEVVEDLRAAAVNQ